ncbi:MAG: AsmA family protein [Sedimenticolaceae bacterium]
MKIALWGLGLIALLALLGTAYLLVYLDRNKALVESAASEALGREVRIDKGISLRWSMRPAITLKGLWIGNPAWARGEYFARADQAFVRFYVAALLGGHLTVDEVVLQQADVALETAEDGRRNWEFGGGPSMLPSPSINSLAFKKSRLRYQSADGKAQQFAFSTLELLGLGTDAPSVAAEFSFAETPVVLKAKVDSGAVAAPAGRAFSGRLSSAGLVVDVSGHAKVPDAALTVDMQVQGERFVLPTALHPSGPNAVDVGPLQRISGRFKSSGTGLEALIANLHGKLDVGFVRLTLPAAQDGQARVIDANATTLALVAGKPMSLHSELRYREQSFALQLTGGTLAGLWSGDKSWQWINFEVDGTLGETPLQLSGRLDSPLAWPAPPRSGEGILELKNIEVKIADSRVTGEMRVALAERGRIEGSFEAQTLDLTPLLSGEGAGTADPWGWLRRPLEFEDLPQRDIDLRLDIAQLRASEVSFAGVQSRATLADRHLQLKGTDRAGKLDILADLQPKGSVWRLHLRNKFELGLVQAIEGKDATTGAPQGDQKITVDIDLVGSGKSMLEVLGSAEGNIDLLAGAGRLSEAIARSLPLGGVFTTLLAAIKAEDSVKAPTQLDCAVFHLDVVAGVATSKQGLALRTDRVNILGTGSLKLASGEIDLTFKTAQRKGVGLSIRGLTDKFVRVTGTVAQPEVELNASGAALTAGAAYLTGGLSLLAEAVFTRLTGFTNPCEIVRAQGQPSNAE